MYWRWSRIPELADLPPEERRRIWNEAKRDPFRPSDLLWFVVLLGIAVGGGVALVYVSKNLSNWIALPTYAVGATVLGALVDAILILRYRPIVRRIRGGG